MLIRQTTVTPTRWTFDTAGRLAEQLFRLGRMAIRNEGGLVADGSEERNEEWTISDFTAEDLEKEFL